jgi:hypothetical protein
MAGVRVQYVYDENGRRTGVIIYNDLETDLEKEARSLRGEWTRRRGKIKLPDLMW